MRKVGVDVALLRRRWSIVVKVVETLIVFRLDASRVAYSRSPYTLGAMPW